MTEVAEGRPWEVVQNKGSGKGRVLTYGPEKAMRKYIEQHFPRMHTDPGSVMQSMEADVHLVSPSGHEERYIGPESDVQWEDVEQEDPAPRTRSRSPKQTKE